VDYLVIPVPLTKVQFEDSFWSPRLATNREVTIPYDFRKCEETGRIANFDRAAGKEPGPHEGIFYDDSDVFKVIEGASYSLSIHPDPELDAYLDDLIARIAAAQEEDGYIYTARTIDPGAVGATREGLTRWSNLAVSHELYNVGHLYEAAVAHHLATGKRDLLDVALKNADLIDREFGPEKRRAVPGHQEIEIGLVRLFRLTAEPRYLRLARFFLDERGRANGRKLYQGFDDHGYMQDHLPVTEQKEAVGHAVRAVYMYTGMADVAALTGDQGYIRALDALWQNVVSRKLYLTGGIGSRHHGEAFGGDYELPNATAYAETCAAIGNILWNHRMFLLHGDATYIDILERTLYNGFLAGISSSGDRFFYPNPLESDGRWEFNRGSAERSPWFDCSCCPTNVVRFLPSLPGYVYANEGDTIYVNLYVAGSGEVEMGRGRVSVEQATRYPWHGDVGLTVRPEQEGEFTLALRIPGWAKGRPVPSNLYDYLAKSSEPVVIEVNGERVDFAVERGFARVRRFWRAGDSVSLRLPLAVRRIESHPKIEGNRGKVAVERGPIVYCAEAVDNMGSVAGLALRDDVGLEPECRDELLGGVIALAGEGITMVPYYAWAQRGPGEMAVWLDRKEG
jgi:DUF1680 family protein